VALVVAIPLGTIIALYLSEFAGFKVREIAKPFLELLGGVPTIVYGYFALTFVTPILQKIYPDLPGFNLLSAGLVMGIMIIPYVASLSEDAMRAVPMSCARVLRDGRDALQTALWVVTPAATSGIASAYILGISRAVGETMILAVAAGMQPNLTFNPTEPGATITSYIVQVALGDLPHGSIGYQTIFAAGLTLLLMTLASTCSATGCASASARSTEHAASRTSQAIRAIITRAQALGPVLRPLLGMLSLMVGVLTFTALFVDMAIEGVPRLTTTSSPTFPSRRAASAGILSAWVGTILVMLVTALSPCRWASPPASISRSTRRRTGSPTSSRSTSATWPASRPSSTACWRSGLFVYTSASARASCPPA
jgi:ABC-type phosphate transport system permease subunit